MTILITGGTGHLGSDVVTAARAAGHLVRIASRRPAPAPLAAGVEWSQTDLVSGRGCIEAVLGADAIIHAASDPRNATADLAGTRQLLEAARAAGASHLVFVSIVGIGHIPIAYYKRKLEIEQMIAARGVPYSILRATQFQYFIDMILHALTCVPLVLPLPRGFHVQSVATQDVAARLLAAVEHGPGGLLRDFAGPQPMTLCDAASLWKAARNVSRPIVEVPIPGAAAKALRAAYNTAPAGGRGVITARVAGSCARQSREWARIAERQKLATHS